MLGHASWLGCVETCPVHLPLKLPCFSTSSPPRHALKQPCQALHGATYTLPYVYTHGGCCCAGLMAGFNRLKRRFSKSRDPFNGQPYSCDESSLRQAFLCAADLTELLCDIVELDMTPSQSYIIMRLLRRGDRTNLAGTTTPFSMHQIHRQLPKVTSAIAFHVQILRSKESLLFDAKNEDTGEMEGFRAARGSAPGARRDRR